MYVLTDLEMGNFPGLSEWAQYNDGGPCKREAGELESRREDIRMEGEVREKRRCVIARFEMEGSP